MTRDDFSTEVLEELRRTRGSDPAFVSAVMREVRHVARAPRRRMRSLRWMLVPAAAALAVAIGAVFWDGGADTSGLQPIQFVLVEPGAREVWLVGDFNDWDPRATPMSRSGNEGLWSVQLALPAGRHGYAFVVDGQTWRADDTAPRGPESDFGNPSSVLLVGAGDE